MCEVKTFPFPLFIYLFNTQFRRLTCCCSFYILCFVLVVPFLFFEIFVSVWTGRFIKRQQQRPAAAVVCRSFTCNPTATTKICSKIKIASKFEINLLARNVIDKSFNGPYFMHFLSGSELPDAVVYTCAQVK